MPARGMSRRTGQAFEGLTGSESNTDASGNTVTVFQIDHTAHGRLLHAGR